MAPFCTSEEGQLSVVTREGPFHWGYCILYSARCILTRTVDVHGLFYYITMFFKLACCCWNFMIVSCFNMFSALLMLTYFLSCQRLYRDITWSNLEKDSPVASPQRRAAASFSCSEKHLVGWAGNYTTRPPFLDLYYSMGPIVAPHFGIPVNQPVYWVFFCSSCLHLIARFPTNTTSIFSSPLLLMVFVRIWCAMCEKTSIWRYSYSSMAIIVIRWDMNHGPWPNSQKTWRKNHVNGLVRLSKDPNPEVLKRRLLWLLCPNLSWCFSSFWALNSKEKHSSPLKSIFADKILLGDNLIICWNVWKTTLVRRSTIHRISIGLIFDAGWEDPQVTST